MENSHCSDCLLSIPLTTSEMADKIWGTDLALFSAWPKQTLFLTLVGQSCRNDGFCWIPCRSAPSWANSAHVSTRAREGDYCFPRQSFYFTIYTYKYPKKVCDGKLLHAFPMQVSLRLVALIWGGKQFHAVRSGLRREVNVPFLSPHTEDGWWQMCHGYATRDFHLLES